MRLGICQGCSPFWSQFAFCLPLSMLEQEPRIVSKRPGHGFSTLYVVAFCGAVSTSVHELVGVVTRQTRSLWALSATGDSSVTEAVYARSIGLCPDELAGWLAGPFAWHPLSTYMELGIC